MGFRDLEYAYERFKLDRDIIKPYTDEMEMVWRIQSFEAHFFPWRRWILPAPLSVVLFLVTALLMFTNLWVYGSFLTGSIADYAIILFVGVGIFLLPLAISLRRKYMVISVDGISLPRVFGENQNIPWPSITNITFKASGLGEAITLIIEYRTQKTKTNLGYYTNIYLTGERKELRLVRVLQAYFRLRVQGKDLEPVRTQIKKDLTKRYGLPEAIGSLVIGIWLLIIRGLVFFAGWLILIPAIVMALPLSIVASTCVGLRQGRPWNSKVRNVMVASILVIGICLFIIILMLLPFLP